MGPLLLFSIYFAAFAFIHSLTASTTFKKRAEEILKEKFKSYRLMYNTLGVIAFLPLGYIGIKYGPLSETIYIIPEPFNMFFITIHILAAVLLIYALSQTDIREFLGFTTEKKKGILVTTGLYGIVRHPIYLFAIIFLFTRYKMTVFDLTTACLFTAYFIIGTIFEERKLLAEFGREYAEYKKKVPMFLPLTG